MPFLKNIEESLEKIEKSKVHISGTALGLFFIGFVLLSGLYFTSEDFRDFSTLYLTPRLNCRLPSGWDRNNYSFTVICSQYGPGGYIGEKKVVLNSDKIRDKAESTSYVRDPIELNWVLVLFVGIGLTWFAARRGWARNIVRRLSHKEVGLVDYSKFKF